MENRRRRHIIVTLERTRARSIPDRGAAPTHLTEPSWQRIAVPLGIAMVAASLLWLRIEASARDTLWAEDGGLFAVRSLSPELQDRWIFTPYAGYTHALPQLLSDTIWSITPRPLIALAVTAVTCLVAGTVAAVIYVLTGAWRLHVAGRLMLAAITVLAPGLPYEIAGNLANLHWFLLWLSPFVFLTRPRTWPRAAALAGIAFLVFGSEIQVALFTPLLLLHLRDRRRWPMLAATAAAGSLQLWALVGGVRGRGGGASVPAIIDGYVLQVPMTALTGTSKAASAVISYSGWTAALLSMTPFVICTIWFAVGSFRRWALALGILFASAALWTVGFGINYEPFLDYPLIDSSALRNGLTQLRYGIVPTMLLFGLVALAVGKSRERRWRRWLRSPAAAATALCLAVFAFGFQTTDDPPRAAGPEWPEGLRTAHSACVTTELDAAAVTIAPEWTIHLPCRGLR